MSETVDAEELAPDVIREGRKIVLIELAIMLGAAVILIPWSIYLLTHLDPKPVVDHWDVAWAGFDFMLIVALSVTIWMALKRSIWLPVAGASTATLFVCDAWFDVVTSNPGERLVAIASAILAEIPMAIIGFALVTRSERMISRAEKAISRHRAPSV